ncbi:MAG: hypothetical protein FWE01_02510 [Firmicutes bacterium]|nr:hypothetical protein [Bacillota bacterium]
MSDKQIKDNVEDEADVSLLSLLLDKDNDENIFMHTDGGEVEEFEQIAIVPFEDKMYAILRPVDDDEDVAVIFLVSPEDEDSIIQVTDEQLQQSVIDVYHNS